MSYIKFNEDQHIYEVFEENSKMCCTFTKEIIADIQRYHKIDCSEELFRIIIEQCDNPSKEYLDSVLVELKEICDTYK